MRSSAVWASSHGATALTPVNMNEAVAFMVGRALVRRS